MTKYLLYINLMLKNIMKNILWNLIKKKKLYGSIFKKAFFFKIALFGVNYYIRNLMENY